MQQNKVRYAITSVLVLALQVLVSCSGDNGVASPVPDSISLKLAYGVVAGNSTDCALSQALVESTVTYDGNLPGSGTKHLECSNNDQLTINLALPNQDADYRVAIVVTITGGLIGVPGTTRQLTNIFVAVPTTAEAQMLNKKIVSDGKEFLSFKVHAATSSSAAFVET